MTAIQNAVVAFFAAVWVLLAVILIAGPDVLGLSAAGISPLLFFAAVSLLLAVLMIAVARRWRWTYWLILVAFLAGALRVPASALELEGAIPMDAPGWYVVVQGVIGITQFAIGIAMIATYRRSGVWGRATGPRSSSTRPRPRATSSHR